MFVKDRMTGALVSISDLDPSRGSWTHSAFRPDPLPLTSPELSGKTYRTVANARAALAALDSTARQLPNPRLLRRPTLRFEAQSTSALEGTYEPLAKVLTAGDDPDEPGMREVINYELMAETAFSWTEAGRPLTVPTLSELQMRLVRGTALEKPSSGRIRPVQVVIGRRPGMPVSEFPVKAARFVPPPPGLDLEARVRDLLEWMTAVEVDEIDPVVAAAMAHYQFETLHPFHDGNGRIGRLLIVLQLYVGQTISEPTLTVSPWFETRRREYEDRLLAVSCRGDWDEWVSFFARGIAESATATRRQMLALVAAQGRLKDIIRGSTLRADSAHSLVDLAVSRMTFTVRQVSALLSLSYGRANKLVNSLVELGILTSATDQTYNRRFYAPEVIRALLEAE